MKSQMDAERDAAADLAKATSDVKMIDFTRDTAIFTGALAGIAFVQMLLFVWQLRLLRQSTKDATVAAKAAQEAAQVARESFMTLERPWIFLDGHRIERREGAPIQPSLLNNFWISLVFKNNGRSPAFIKGLAFKIIETKDLPETPDYSMCGSQLQCVATLAAGDSFESGKVGPTPGKDTQYTIFGRLTYLDMAGVEHHTGFAIDVSPNLPAASTNKNNFYDAHD